MKEQWAYNICNPIKGVRLISLIKAIVDVEGLVNLYTICIVSFHI